MMVDHLSWWNGQGFALDGMIAHGLMDWSRIGITQYDLSMIGIGSGIKSSICIRLPDLPRIDFGLADW